MVNGRFSIASEIILTVVRKLLVKKFVRKYHNVPLLADTFTKPGCSYCKHMHLIVFN
jgi:hypothetical protein